MNLRPYLIPAGYWVSLAFSFIWLVAYLEKGELAQAALAVALLALSVSLRAFAAMQNQRPATAKPKRRRTK